MKRILNALTFANVNNLGELRSLLRQVDQPSASQKDQAQLGSLSSLSHASSAAPGIRHAQGAL
ncbi:MAG: hypothetical protein ACM3KD_08240 [Hyphomicrobiaceae bacterium]